MLRMMIDGVPHQQATLGDLPGVSRFLAGVDAMTATGDANDLLYALESSRDYDPEGGLPGIRAKVYALNFSDDEFNPDALGILESRIRSVPGARYAVQAGSPASYGHLTMAHPLLWAAHVRTFMDGLNGTAAPDGPAPAASR